MKKFNNASRTTFAVMGLIIVALLFVTDNPMGALFFSVFSTWPLLIILFLIEVCARPFCQIVLTISSLCYALWFAYLYGCAFYWYVDPQSPILLLFVGVYALPVLVPVWGLVFLMRRRPWERVEMED